MLCIIIKLYTLCHIGVKLSCAIPAHKKIFPIFQTIHSALKAKTISRFGIYCIHNSLDLGRWDCILLVIVI